ncbi:MAG: hypothetical protein ACXV5Q_02060 [Frankiaceae bacterium]
MTTGRRRKVLADVLAAARSDLGIALPPWIVARAVVLATLAFIHYLGNQVSDAQPGVHLQVTGLLGWDAAYYRDIAEHGYANLSADTLRFFPLVPLLARVLGAGHGAGPVLLLVGNAAALGYGMLLVRLLRSEGHPEGTVRRAAWLAALVPSAFVLVMGYAEAVFGVLAVTVFLGLRTRRYGLAAAAGVLAGMCRPIGLLLAIPAAIEVWRDRRGPGPRAMARSASRALAVAGPVLGCGAYLAWAGAKFGEPLQPLRDQTDATHHGIGNPVRVLADAVDGLFHSRVGTGLHVPWLVLFVGLLVVMWRRLPASYTVWSAAVLAVTLLGSNLDSSERYLWSAFPFAVTVAVLCRSTEVERAVLTCSASLLTIYTSLAFLGYYVP